ncbi:MULTISPECIES: ABC transporter ATP-binding protein [Halobacterium]|uniref:ABC transporter ATP-binding protein n=1 Tax=Halobacterium TaxID=2239 RepID=UPI00073ECCEC|nr:MULTISPECIES: ABC transporter ATP-binding protein [Halobacterium]MCG1004577.1 ABC transporter ATP-binding protein [Halobacterium noricense]
MPDPTIDIRSVQKSYGTVTALDGASLSVDRGETLGLVGRNGAGKTTLFKLLVGHETPDAGSVTVAGLSPSAGTALRERVGYLPEHAGFPPSLTGREVLSFHARVRGVSADTRDRRVERVLRTVGLADDADRRVGGYSNGMNRRLGLATALVGDPDVLLLDEPTASLDPAGVADFHAVVDALATETDVTVLVSSHVLPEIERLCDRVAVLEDGDVSVSGSVDDLRRAAADTVTVDATVAGDADAAAASLAPEDGVARATANGTRVHVDCDRERVFDVLDALREAADVDAVEVTEPGLDAVFREEVAAGGDVSLGTGGERA